MTKMRSHLPKANTQDKDLDAFITGAEIKPLIPANTVPGDYPWQDPKVREDVLKVYNLRLPEPYLLKLKYIAENTPESMQKFCLQVIQEAIDKKITELT